MIKFDLIPTPVYLYTIGGLALALVVGLGIQEVRIAGARAHLALEQKARSDETSLRASAALVHTGRLAQLGADHAAATQTKENENAEKIRKLEADKRSSDANADRLRNKLASFAASGARAGETCTAALERTADRLGVVSGLLSESIGLVTEGRQIIDRRDIEVGGLLQQIKIDRAACNPPAGTSGAPLP